MAKVYIIAEAGVNHNGCIETAKKMIEVAAWAGADAIKFQTFKSENLVTQSAKKAEYQQESDTENTTQLEMLKKLELAYEDYPVLIEHCRLNNISFLSTPFDFESLDFLNTLDMNIMKIASGEITNLPFLRKIGETQKHVVLSTGMATIGEIENAISILKQSGSDNISVLHCNTEYPTPFEDVNLRAMQTIKQAFQVDVGYSDHTEGIEVPIAAVALGAKIIEKHFTLDRNMTGPDHKASIEPEVLKMMVDSIRNIEKSLGNGIKTPSSSESKNIAVARKSIVAKRRISQGELFTEENLTVKRPGTGISPMRWDEVIGKKSNYNFEEDELIKV